MPYVVGGISQLRLGESYLIILHAAGRRTARGGRGRVDVRLLVHRVVRPEPHHLLRSGMQERIFYWAS